MLTAGLIVEYVFNVPGVGLTYYTAAVNADYPVELGITVLVGAATVLGSLLADLAYAVLDPRVRYAEACDAALIGRPTPAYARRLAPRTPPGRAPALRRSPRTASA